MVIVVRLREAINSGFNCTTDKWNDHSQVKIKPI